MSDQIKASLELPQGVIEAHIHAAVLNALSEGNKDELVKSMINTVLKQKVNDGYRSTEKNVVVHAFEQAVLGKVKSLMEEIIQTDAEKIKEILRKQMKTPVFYDALLKGVLEGLSSSRWTVDVSFGVKQR